ncbi:hypothetical protein [Pseudovibrio sp. SPO723]|uniref:hypothetical protein n=1 Tax=Nesiotobacter zosterae TaxID=392721 RepID=UPI0029C1AA5B|nr:hypothetical protein [Pseudovibrio sp. SPO723]MDX5592929.1 hypothetical protein [Pseudovibrio sp. SPO723]
MPLQNRVLPDGTLVAIPSRGTMMGNRGGRHHDPQTKCLLKPYPHSKRWICCRLSFKDRQRSVWGDSYTELFFLDEVTALAAGHRPCFECRRGRALEYAELFTRQTPHTANWGPPRASAYEMDRALSSQRQQTHPLRSQMDALPEGAVLTFQQDNEKIFAAKGPYGWLRWTTDGYKPLAMALPSTVELVTPPITLAILGSGYKPEWHQTAIGRPTYHK